MVPGFYGKLPSFGDFISRRLLGSFVRPWDAWLQNAIFSSRNKLGERWLETYLTSPVWRFLLSAGACGNDACMGVLMPSVDKVGRYFPLTLAVLIEPRAVLPGLFVEGAEWFEKIETLALSSLEDDFDFEHFDRELQNTLLPPMSPNEESLLEPDWPDSESRPLFRIAVSEPGKLRDAFVELSGFLLGRSSPAYTLWCAGGENEKTTLLAFDGLPSPSAFTELVRFQE
ncbi:MAG: type VI secretion system-associated protein TagF [Syntrophobacteraceae bacterium]|nr:type VI secretion system-associated protein TagF [Syntrophobacteraceae bacterium]